MTPPRRGRPRLSRFAATAAASSLLLLLATVAVFAGGDRVVLEPIGVAPIPAEENVSTGASLYIRFARAMKPATVEARLRLDPPAEGDFAWTGTTLIFTPRQPLRPATEYLATLEPGLEEARGRRSRQVYQWRFRTRAPGVVVRRRVDGVANLWLIDPAGGPPRQLTRETTDVTEFSVAPNGEHIAYARAEARPGASPVRSLDDLTSLWRLDLRSAATARLSPDEPAAFTAPAWSPGSDLIVYERRQSLAGAIGNPKLFAAQADGTPGGLIHGRGDEVAYGPRWSPDGTRIAFFDAVNQRVTVFNFTRDLVSIPSELAVSFDWSPDSRSLVVEDVVVVDGKHRHVLVIAEAATGATRRLSTEAADDNLPAWSPDGTAIAFTRRPASNPSGGDHLWLIAPDGRAARPVTPSTPTDLATLAVRWSPDGQSLLLVRQSVAGSSDPARVWLVDAAGQTPPRLLGDGDAAAWLS